jgi:hydroxymethylpyrimidine pyrophosphatase-like HAD family hydrolase
MKLIAIDLDGKGAELQVFALTLGISLDDTMAVGNNYN